MKMAQDAIDRMGGRAEVHFKYTCDNCGERMTFAEADILYENGECAHCGHEQPVVLAGFDLRADLRR